MRIINVSDTHASLIIADTDQEVAFGEEVEVEDAKLADSLIASGLWARPTTKAARAATKEGS